MPWPHAALKALIDSEPSNSGLTDAQVLAWLKVGETTQGPISASDYREWLSSNLRGWAIRCVVEDGAYHSSSPGAGLDPPDNVPSDAVKNAAWVARAIALSGDGIDLGRPGAGAALAPLVGTVFTTADRNALLAYGQTSAPRWAALRTRASDDASWLYHIAVARAL